MTVTTISLSEVALPSKMTQILIHDDATTPALTLLAGVTGKKIYVWGAELFVNGASDLQFRSNTTDIGGTYGFGAEGNVVLPKPVNGDPAFHRAYPYAVTNAGDPLVIGNSTGARLSGCVYVSQQ